VSERFTGLPRICVCNECVLIVTAPFSGPPYNACFMAVRVKPLAEMLRDVVASLKAGVRGRPVAFPDV
jgi:hypothetical protein